MERCGYYTLRRVDLFITGPLQGTRTCPTRYTDLQWALHNRLRSLPGRVCPYQFPKPPNSSESGRIQGTYLPLTEYMFVHVCVCVGVMIEVSFSVEWRRVRVSLEIIGVNL